MDELAANAAQLMWSARLLTVVRYLYDAGQPQLAYSVLETQDERDRRRQPRAAGLRPGGHDPVAQIRWTRYGQPAVAYLWARPDNSGPEARTPR